MSHYFIEDKTLEHDIKKIEYFYFGNNFSFTTDSGVFSKDHIDPATSLLLSCIPALSGSLLDMGCGYGCIGIVLAKTYGVRLTQADVNQSAVDLTKLNCAENGVKSDVILSNLYENITGTFDTITINPPIHAGKSVVYEMFDGAFSRLNSGGRLYVVTLRKHGAESTRAKLEGLFGNCDAIYKKKGYYVFCCVRI